MKIVIITEDYYTGIEYDFTEAEDLYGSMIIIKKARIGNSYIARYLVLNQEVLEELLWIYTPERKIIVI